jgi:hypothetical protein
MSKLWDEIRFLTSEAWDFLLPIIKIFMSKIGPVLMTSALKAVQVAASSGLKGGEAQKVAYNEILKDLEAQGISAATSTINSAIEAAYQKLNPATIE